MEKKLIVNCDSREIRVGLMEDKRLVEMYIERPENQRVVGNIYKGRVSNVLPGMQAAFVDIGLEKNAFLYVSEAIPSDTAIEYDRISEQVQIKDILNQGQELMVQVIKEPFGSKGARVSTNLNIPGRFLVLMPSSKFIGISKKVESETVRERLKGWAEKLLQEYGVGMIVRTVAKDADFEQLKKDYQFLIGVWESVKSNALKFKTPGLIHRDLEILPRIIRDILNDEIDEIVIDTYEEYMSMSKNIDKISPNFKTKITYFKDPVPIFDHFQIEEHLLKALRNKVWLNNGGYLIIDRTEALTVIDVNTGKYVGQRNLEDTVVDTNIEAAKEVAYQLRLRNLSGIIIVDFIDMHIVDNQLKVLQVLEQELKRDSNKTHLLGITKLGLVEITRKKIRKSLYETLYETCPTCNGIGSIATNLSIANKIDREVRHYLRHTKDDAIILEMHQDIVEPLIGEKQENLHDIESTFAKKVYIKAKQNIDLQYYNILYSGDENEVKQIMQSKR